MKSKSRVSGLLALLGISGSMAAQPLQAQHMCLTGPRADAFLGLVRRAVAESNPALRSPEVPTIPLEQVRLVRDESVCVAVSKALGGQRGAFVSNGPYIVIRAGPRFFIHDSVPEPALGDLGLGAARYVVIDTLQPPPRAGYGMPGECWTHECLCRSPWTLLGPVTLRRVPARAAPVVAQLPARAHVDSDTALTIVDSVGLVIVERPTWSVLLNDTLPAGDTLLTLRWGKSEDSDVRGYLAWWRGQIVHVEQFWDSAGTRARSVREPSWSVWAHVILSDGKQRVVGWALMTPDTRVDGPNCY